MVSKAINKFAWNGLFWTTEASCDGRKIQLGIEAKENQKELVKTLTPLAHRFSEFWSDSRVLIATEVRNWLTADSSVDDLRPARCTAKTVKIGDSGWVVSQFVNKQGKALNYFEMYIFFEDSHGLVYGEGVRVKVVGRVSEGLKIDAELMFDLTVL